jgi:hypothetical protein
MEKLALSVVIGGAIASSFNSSIKTSSKSLSQIGSEIHKMNKTKVDIKRFKELQKNTQGNRKEFVKLGRSLKDSGVDLNNFSNYTTKLNTKLKALKKNLLIKGKIQIEKDNLFAQKDSLLATFGTGMAISGMINLRSEILQAQGELKSLKIDDVGIAKITKQAKEFSNTFAGTTQAEFIKASYDIKSGIASLGDEAVGSFTRLAAMTAGATKSSTTQMTSFFATGYGIYSKQFSEFGAKTIKGWNNLSQEERDIKFGESFSAGIGSAVQMFKTDGTKMQNAIETLGAAATTSNVPFAEQVAILGSMQKSFASGSEAATAYKGFLTGAVAAQEKLGLEFLDSNNQLKSAPLILNELKNKYGETLDDMEKQEIKKAFGTEEGMKFITAFYGEIDELETSINGMGKSIAGGTKTINDMMAATQQGKGFALLGQQMSNLGSSIGKILYPAVSALGTILGALVVGLDSFIDTFPLISSGIGYVVVGIFSYIAISKTAKLISMANRIAMLSLRGSFLANIPVLKSLRLSYNRLNLATMTSSIKTKALAFWTTNLSSKQKLATLANTIFSTSLKLVSGAAKFAGRSILWLGRALMMNPIGLAVTVIAGAAYMIYKYWEPIKNFFGSLWDGIKNIFSSTIDIIKTYLGWTPLGMILNNWGIITSFFGGLWDGVVNIFSNAWNAIKSSFSGVVDFIKQPFVSFFDWIAAKFGWISDFIGNTIGAISNIGDKVSDTVGNIGTSIGDSLKTASNWFKFGNDEEDMNTSTGLTKTSNQKPANSPKYKIGDGVKKVAVATAVSSQLVSAQPNLNYTKIPEVKKETAKPVQQTNHIKVIVNNPSSTVEVEKAMTKALAHGGNDRSLSDEDI